MIGSRSRECKFRKVGNTAFYAVPSAETITRWRQETPETFRFCPKVSRDISHASRLDVSQKETMVFVERMRGLGSRLGPMFLQLPPTFTPDQLPQLQTFLDFWPTDVRLAVEVRHQDFFAEPHATTLNMLLQQHQVARIIMDTRPIRVGSQQEQKLFQQRERKPHLPLQLTATTDFTFVRYIGNPGMEANQTFLSQWAQQLGEWHKQGLTTYTFCHCPFEQHSPAICAELYQKTRKLIPLPALPWSVEKTGVKVEQARLF